MDIRTFLNRLLILVFMGSIGFCLALSIKFKSTIGFLLALMSLVASIHFLYLLAKARRSAEQDERV
ncbi:MAG TPA: hypothetical protein VLJ68_01860 [Chitinophagaceae bacterium]|nr:hypothetical protein [Chitinophagaceae bacterium]